MGTIWKLYPVFYVRCVTLKKRLSAVMAVAKRCARTAECLIYGATDAVMAILKPSAGNVMMIPLLISGKRRCSNYFAIFTEAKLRLIPFLNFSIG